MDPSPAPHLQVVLVNYRRWRDALRCVGYLGLAGVAAEDVLIVDCGSGEGSAERLARHHPPASVLPLAENLGFAGGCNHGAAEALARGAESLLFLNTDTAFAPDFVARLAAAARAWPGACLSPEIFWAGQPERLWSAGLWRGRLPGSFRARRPGEVRCEVDYLFACCLWLPRAAWEAVGPFDRRYFLYYEDMDWSERARARGFGLRVEPAVRLWHAVGAASGGPDSPLRRYHLTRSSLRFFRRQGPAALPLRALVDARIALGLAASGRPELLAAHLAGWRDGLGAG